MKYILQIAAGLSIGGAEKVTRDIGLYRSGEGYETHYVVFGDTVGEYESQLLERGCRIFHIPSPAESYRSYLRRLEELMRIPCSTSAGSCGRQSVWGFRFAWPMPTPRWIPPAAGKPGYTRVLCAR